MTPELWLLAVSILLGGSGLIVALRRPSDAQILRLQNELLELQRQHKVELDGIKKDGDERVERIRKNYQEEIEALQQRYMGKVNALTADLAQMQIRLGAYEAEKRNWIDEVSELRREIHRLQEIIAWLRGLLREHKVIIDPLPPELRLPEKRGGE